MKDKNGTKTKIVKAMYNIIVEEGYEKASIGKICDSIGITKASAYYYFKSKEDIFLEIVKNSYEYDFSTFVETVNAVTNKSDYKTELLNLGFRFIEAYENDQDFRKVCYEIHIQSYRIEKVKEIVSEFEICENQMFIKVLAKGSELKLFAHSTIETKAQYLQTIIIGLDDAVLFQSPINAKEVWRYTIDQLLQKKVS